MGLGLNTTSGAGTLGAGQYQLTANQYIKYAKSSSETVSLVHANQVRHYVLIIKRSQPLAIITRSHLLFNSTGIKSDFQNIDQRALQNSQAICLTSQSAPVQFLTSSGITDSTIFLPNATLLPLGTTYEFVFKTQHSIRILSSYYVNTLPAVEVFNNYIKFLLKDNTSIDGTWYRSTKS